MSGSGKTGDRLFVVGNGPTMARVDLSLLKDENTLVFNDITARLDQFTPTYWMFFDGEVYKGYKKEILAQRAKGTELITIIDTIPDVRERVKAFGLSRPLFEGKMEFYDRHNGTIFSVGAIGYAGLQWAWQEGYRGFYVMGFDSRDPRPTEHYCADYCARGRKMTGYSSLPEDIWGKAYDYANTWIWANGGQIWDVSHSKCGSFRYKDLDEILNG